METVNHPAAQKNPNILINRISILNCNFSWTDRNAERKSQAPVVTSAYDNIQVALAWFCTLRALERWCCNGRIYCAQHARSPTRQRHLWTAVEKSGNLLVVALVPIRIHILVPRYLYLRTLGRFVTNRFVTAPFRHKSLRHRIVSSQDSFVTISFHHVKAGISGFWQQPRWSAILQPSRL